MITAQRDGEIVDLAEGNLGPREMAQRDRSVETHHRAVRHAHEDVVEDDDLVPVRLRPRSGLRMQRRDRRLHLVRTARPHCARALQRRNAVGDRRVIPQRAVLVRQQHHLARCIEPRFGPREIELHQDEQAEHLGLVRHEGCDQACQPERVIGNIAPHRNLGAAAQVTLVEHQVEDGQNPI